MASQVPSQSSCNQNAELAKLAKQVGDWLKENSLTQHDFCERTTMPETRLFHILHADGKVRISERDIDFFALGFGLTPAERDELRYQVYPWLRFVDNALIKKQSVRDLDMFLYENGHPLFGYHSSDEILTSAEVEACTGTEELTTGFTPK